LVLVEVALKSAQQTELIQFLGLSHLLVVVEAAT
jgi:hypothetical protein